MNCVMNINPGSLEKYFVGLEWKIVVPQFIYEYATWPIYLPLSINNFEYGHYSVCHPGSTWTQNHLASASQYTFISRTLGWRALLYDAVITTAFDYIDVHDYLFLAFSLIVCRIQLGKDMSLPLQYLRPVLKNDTTAAWLCKGTDCLADVMNYWNIANNCTSQIIYALSTFKNITQRDGNSNKSCRKYWKIFCENVYIVKDYIIYIVVDDLRKNLHQSRKSIFL